jgi:hypothetical protein
MADGEAVVDELEPLPEAIDEPQDGGHQVTGSRKPLSARAR